MSLLVHITVLPSLILIRFGENDLFSRAASSTKEHVYQSNAILHQLDGDIFVKVEQVKNVGVSCRCYKG
ncbi:MAG: hypothetical protein JO327_04285 [Nitrososphaeraceae archaeon]|nr:hypothetical protein [Nitrososphaeraceae archaeon]